MRIVPFDPHHLQLLRLRELERLTIGDLTRIEAYGARIAEPGFAFTGIADGDIDGAAGVAPMWDGVGQAWTLLSPLFYRHVVSFHRGTRRFLDGQTRFHRIQTSVLSGFDVGCRWAERLGFVREGLMRCYGPDGSDHYLYARLRDV